MGFNNNTLVTILKLNNSFFQNNLYNIVLYTVNPPFSPTFRHSFQLSFKIHKLDVIMLSHGIMKLPNQCELLTQTILYLDRSTHHYSVHSVVAIGSFGLFITLTGPAPPGRF